VNEQLSVKVNKKMAKTWAVTPTGSWSIDNIPIREIIAAIVSIIEIIMLW
jgi:hypothetical protein